MLSAGCRLFPQCAVLQWELCSAPIHTDWNDGEYIEILNLKPEQSYSFISTRPQNNEKVEEIILDFKL